MSSLTILFLSFILLARRGHGFGTFGFDIHHLYSDPVRGILAVDGGGGGDDQLPVKGSLQYYAAMAHRDRLIRGRGLASAEDGDPAPLTFAYGNETYRINSLGFLHYANVSVGTPRLSFLVALDTGSDLFWLPCDCRSCVHGLQTSSGQNIELNIYSPNASSTSEKVLCSSNLCSQSQKSRCSSAQSICPYKVQYLSNGTASLGYLVEDVLHLVTDNAQTKAVGANITFGCGKIQTGSFLDGAAPNGLFGLGMSNISVPSTLAREGYTSNSFSMCFGSNIVGRITFGDKGSSDQGETSFNIQKSHPTYNISLTQINVGGNAADLEFTAIFDTGTSFTYLNDPAYSLISENFNNLVEDSRYSSSDYIPFEYCYNISSIDQGLKIPTLSLIMQGGDVFNLTNPIVVIELQANAYIYCLGMVKSADVNIIGQNFMTGYRIVFDRERNVLGWKASNCYDVVDSNTMPLSPTSSSAEPPHYTRPLSPTSSSTEPPASAVKPEATAGSGSNAQVPGATPPSGNGSQLLKPLRYVIMMVLIPFLSIF